jgi:hypothetical protein
MRVDRRALLAGVGLVVAGAAAALMRPWRRRIAGTSTGPDRASGHRLRDGGFPAPERDERTRILIAGGGIAGLAAGWTLTRAGFLDFRLLELESEPGGNARGGRNAISAYPLGAHYLPVQNVEAKAVRTMLRDFGMIVGERDSRPVYDPLQLCADLEERLLWRGRWQEGLIPRTGLTPQDKADLGAFDAAMAQFSRAVGSDGKPAFALPIAYSSADPAFTALDRLDFAHWLDTKGWRSPVLRAHVRYACRDDYGTEPEHVSAWAGIHYFAGRRGDAADGAGDSLLTWPEGNAHLVRRMAATFAQNITPRRIAFRAGRSGEGVTIDSFDIANAHSIRTHADAAIITLPHFISSRIVEGGSLSAEGFSYAPWLVANVSVSRPPAGRGANLAWDNVSASSASLGYVVATHQSSATSLGPTVLTWYMPLSDRPPAEARRLLLDRPEEEWRQMVVDDLLLTNPDLEGAIERVDLWPWGHAMIRPTPGFIFGTAPRARAALAPPLFQAHSDLGGLSLFEEAHYRGVAAAEAAMAHLTHPYESML